MNKGMLFGCIVLSSLGMLGSEEGSSEKEVVANCIPFVFNCLSFSSNHEMALKRIQESKECWKAYAQVAPHVMWRASRENNSHIHRLAYQLAIIRNSQDNFGREMSIAGLNFGAGFVAGFGIRKVAEWKWPS